MTTHYRHDNLEGLIMDALQQAKSLNKPFDHRVISALDQFHIGGLGATLEMLDIAPLKPHDRVLDIGCGIGGPARTIASHRGCHVTGIDLSKDYCEAASLISRQLGMTQQTRFLQADAQKLPFQDNSFTALWTQHLTMNIKNKKKLWQEFFRTLQPNGRLIMYEVTTSDHGNNDINYPVPWAQDINSSFLASQRYYLESLSSCGFDIEHKLDISSHAQISIQGIIERIEQGKNQRPGLEQLLGDNFINMMHHLLQGLSSGALSVIQIIARKA